MENYRRGGNDRRTAGRSDYGRRNSERNFSENRRFSDSYSHRPRHESHDGDASEAPKRRPRVIRSKDGALRSMSPAQRGFSHEDHGYGSSEGRSYNRSGEGRGSYGSPERRGYGSPRRSFGQDSRRSQGPERRYSDEGRYSDERRRPFGERRSSGSASRGYSSSSRPARGFSNDRRPRVPAENGINRMISRKQLQDEARYSDNDMVNVPVKEEVRLNKFIANSGICSRREADNYILAGVVTVNGEVVTELGSKVNIHTDDVRFNGERLKGEEKVYIVMNKPKGYVTTASDPHAEKTVMDLLKGCKARVFPVGRLDKYTTGVLMFTNDGEIAEKLTHPSYDKKKIYQVTLDKDLSAEDFDKVKSGIMLTDGEIAADELEYIDETDHRKLGIEIHSGKNRIVRRIFESLGYEVRGLDRVYFAGLTKKGLKKGQWRFLTQGEENILKMGAYN